MCLALIGGVEVTECGVQSVHVGLLQHLYSWSCGVDRLENVLVVDLMYNVNKINNRVMVRYMYNCVL